MFTQKIKYFLYGIIISASLISIFSYASWPDGVFGDYFQNIINNSVVCNDPNAVVTGFDNTLGASYGTKICRTIKDLVSSLGIFNNAGDIGIGTNTPGAKLTVNGNIQIKDGTEWAGKVLTSDAIGKASWQNQVGGGSAWQKVLRGRTTVGFFNGQPESVHSDVSFGETCTNPRISVNAVEWSSSIKCSNAANNGVGICPNYPTTDSQDMHAYAFNITNAGFKTMLSWMNWVWVGWASPAYPIDWIAVCDEKVWGGAGWSWWENIPLTDTTDFDVACEYRFSENIWWGITYPTTIRSNAIFFETSTAQFALWRIDKWNKKIAYYTEDGDVDDVDGNRCTAIVCGNWNIAKMEKRCWNSSQSWYKKVCDVAYAGLSFVAPTNSHMHSISVPDSWTSETCRWYMWQTKWWAQETHYRLGCIDSSGVSQWTYSSVNAWTADAWIPAANCGW